MKTKRKREFDPETYVQTIGGWRQVQTFRKRQAIFSQGQAADTVMYVQKGSVKLTVVNESGKEAVVALFGPGDFFGEGGMAGQTIRLGTATAVMPTNVLLIGKTEMVRALHAEPELSDRFIKYILSRNIRVEADLIDQLFNSTEKRLARTLLLLARYGKEDEPQKILLRVSQETLAEMIGTTRSRVNLFMNKFKKLGFIDNKDGLEINSSLLSVVLHD